jgi:hypothetical protein
MVLDIIGNKKIPDSVIPILTWNPVSYRLDSGLKSKNIHFLIFPGMTAAFNIHFLIFPGMTAAFISDKVY